MALQFQGAPDWLLQEYAQRKQPAEIASEGIGNAINSYVGYKQQQQQQASLDAMRKANEFKAVADYIPEEQIPAVAKQYGINIPTQQPVVPSTGPVTAGLPSPTTGQISIQSDHPDIQPGSPIHASLMAGHPDLTGLLNRPMPTSKAGKAKYKSDVDMAKTMQGLGPQAVMTKEQALAAGTIEPNARIIEPTAEKTGPDRFATLSDKQLADAQKAYNSDKNIEKSQAVVDKVSQAVPLLKAGAVDNATAKQALQTAMTYMATGGMRVNEVELKQFGGANSLTNKMGQWYQRLDAGTLTKRDAQDMGKVLDIFQKSAEKNLREGGLRHTRQYLQRSRSGETENDAYKRVTGIDLPPPDVIPPGENSVTPPNTSSVPEIGATFNGGKVLKVTRIK